MYVAACYLVGTGMCHNMVGLLQHYRDKNTYSLKSLNSSQLGLSKDKQDLIGPQAKRGLNCLNLLKLDLNQDNI